MPLDQPKSAAQRGGEEIRMTFGEHLEELRARLLRMIYGLVAAAVVTFYFGFELIAWLAQPMLQALDALGYAPQTYAFDPTAGFSSVYLKVSLIAAVILASPWILYQAWGFVVEGLYEHEKRTMRLLAPFSTGMGAMGVLFTYYVLLPVSLVFFLGFAASYPAFEPGQPSFMIRLLLGERATPAVEAEAASGGGETGAAAAAPLVLPLLGDDPAEPTPGSVWINQREGRVKAYFGGQVRAVTMAPSRMLAPMPDIGQYVRFAAFMMLGIVVAFQLPVVMLVMGWSGLFDPAWFAAGRKYALFGSFALGAVLTPTDLFSMFVLAVPLYGLFEMGLWLMGRVYTPPIMDDEHP